MGWQQCVDFFYFVQSDDNSMTHKVLLYEDNEPLRNSIAVLMQWDAGYELIAAKPNTLTLIRDIEEYQPDVILMDIDMPPTNGVEAVRQLRTIYTDLPVIMLTVFEDNDNIINAIQAGASGYLLKKDMEHILSAIKDVLTGGAPMTSSVARKILQLFPGRKEKLNNAESLTKRELEILQLLKTGQSYKMIAAELKIGIETVRSHLKKIYKKLQVNSATEAVYKSSQS